MARSYEIEIGTHGTDGFLNVRPPLSRSRMMRFADKMSIFSGFYTPFSKMRIVKPTEGIPYSQIVIAGHAKRHAEEREPLFVLGAEKLSDAIIADASRQKKGPVEVIIDREVQLFNADGVPLTEVAQQSTSHEVTVLAPAE